MNTTIKTFTEWAMEIGDRKTGYYAADGEYSARYSSNVYSCIDTYTKRNGSNERVIRVTWYEINRDYDEAEARKLQWKKNHGFRTKVPQPIWERVTLYPFTEEGLEAAKHEARAVANNKNNINYERFN